VQDSTDAANYLYNTYVAQLTNKYDVDPGITNTIPVPGASTDFGTLKDYPAWATTVTYKGAFDPNGENYFEKLNKIKIDWISSFTISKQNEPDLRFF
jgi:hypothetical protein